ncbi:MAG: hypothetical protein GX214_01260 [Clostridiales bacterium]|nr:hypothetical protein [Clostridiales bacterium]
MDNEKNNMKYLSTNDSQSDTNDNMSKIGHTPAISMANILDSANEMSIGMTPAIPISTYPLQNEMNSSYNYMKRMYCMHMYMAYIQKAEAYKHKMMYYNDSNHNGCNGNCRCY